MSDSLHKDDLCMASRIIIVLFYRFVQFYQSIFALPGTPTAIFITTALSNMEHE